jgi:glutamine synthetase
LKRLEQDQSEAQGMGSPAQMAEHVAKQVVPAMLALRSTCDRLEAILPDENWTLPKYREMLFIR